MEAKGARRYSYYSFTTLALYGGEWSNLDFPFVQSVARQTLY
jgi:hypothetical protein